MLFALLSFILDKTLNKRSFELYLIYNSSQPKPASPQDPGPLPTTSQSTPPDSGTRPEELQAVTTPLPASKRKVLILGDSQARGLCQLLQKLLGDNYDIFSYVRPGGRLSFVVRDLSDIIQSESLTKDDFLVILGGSNDLSSLRQSRDPANAVKRINFASELSYIRTFMDKVNILVSEIPPRFDFRWSSRDIRVLFKSLNGQLSNFFYDNQVDIVSLNNLHRRDFSREGLHYSSLGKSKLAKCIVKKILNRVNGGQTFLL